MIKMGTAKIFLNGKSQAVRLPKEYRFSGSEVGIKKIGDIVLLYPKDAAMEAFLKVPPISDDFADAIFEARREDSRRQQRELSFDEIFD